MRRALAVATLLALACTIALTACRRHLLCCGPTIQPGLTGSWLLTRVQGGIAGVDIHVPADSPVILTLNHDSSYYMQNRSVMVDSGTFHLTDTPIYFSTPQPAIVFGKGAPTAYNLVNDTLYLGADIGDDFVKTYLKIN